MGLFVVFFAAVMLLMWQDGHALFMEIFPGDMRCIGQELDRLETAVFATYANSATKDGKQKLTLRIADPDEEEVIYERIPITGKKQEFSHKVVQRGAYEMCFELHDGKTPVKVFFHVDYKALAEDGKDLSRQVSKDDVPTLQAELQQIERRIKEISLEVDHAKRQEASLNAQNELTNSRIQWFSMLSVFVLLGTSAWQMFYLRRFFTSKKLL